MEWYFSFETLRPLVELCLVDKKSILEIGCGDSPLIEKIASMITDQQVHLAAIDFSRIIIDELENAQSNKTTNKVHYQFMDARKLQYTNQTFDFIIEKGTIDAALCEKVLGFDNVKQILKESFRVLKPEGKLMIISHISFYSDEFSELYGKCILPALVEFPEKSFVLDIHMIGMIQEGLSYASVYIFTCNKRPKTRAVTNLKSSLDSKRNKVDLLNDAINSYLLCTKIHEHS